MDGDKRLADRVEILGQLDGVVRVFHPMAIRQISAGGALIETAFPLHLDALHDFRLELGDRSVVIKGRVVHSHISDVDPDHVAYHSGIEFVDVAPRVNEALEEFVALIQRERQP
jgi:c-di-GMP-binding flagellar brake protein YcgR